MSDGFFFVFGFCMVWSGWVGLMGLYIRADLVSCPLLDEGKSTLGSCDRECADGCRLRARYVAERESCVCMWRCNAMQQKTEMIMMMMMRVHALMRERLCVSG